MSHSTLSLYLAMISRHYSALRHSLSTTYIYQLPLGMIVPLSSVYSISSYPFYRWLLGVYWFSVLQMLFFNSIARVYHSLVSPPTIPKKQDDAIRIGLLGASTIAYATISSSNAVTFSGLSNSELHRASARSQ